jgi:hypothetical protein
MTPLIQGSHQEQHGPGSESTFERRALAMWPRLDRTALRRCRHDPRRIAALVSHRTSLPLESIERLLFASPVTSDEAATWFG